MITMKILLPRLWELRVGWDDSVPEEIGDIWRRWRSELSDLSTKGISHCYFPKEATVESIQIQSFSDASEDAYAGVVYLRSVDSGSTHLLSCPKPRCLPSNGYLSHVLSSVVPMSSHASFNAPRKCFRYQCPTYMLGLIAL